MSEPLRQPAPVSRAAGRPRGFTLIELLLVMFVMAVLVALVVGVGTYVIDEGRKTETLNKQSFLINAINAYHRVTQKYPPDNVADANESIPLLFEYLNGDKTGSPLKEEILEATRPFTKAIVGGANTDAFGTTMRYYRALGLGGKPLILSAGPDEDFGETDPDKATDNIRSDTKR